VSDSTEYFDRNKSSEKKCQVLANGVSK